MKVKTKFYELFRRICVSTFLKSVLTLSSGVVIAQGISFIGMPFVGRLYKPSAIGDYTVITTNANVIASVACLGMMTALMLPKTDEESRSLCKLVTFSTLIITTFTLACLYFISPIFLICNTKEASYEVSLLALWMFIVFSTMNNICYSYINRLQMYRVMFWNPIIGTGVSVVAGITFGFLGWGFIGYTLAHILSYIVNLLHLMVHANPYQREKESRYHFFILLRNYKRFPLYQMPANLIANMGTQIPVLLLESVYGANVLGMYSMALRVLSLPSSLLATPINRVYFQEASRRYNQGENIGEFSFKILETNIKTAIVPILILVIFGKQIFSVFLGEQWRTAGAYAAVLGIYQLMLFCINCLSGDFVIIKKNSWNLLSSIITLVINVSLLILCKSILNLTAFGFLIVLSGVMTMKMIGAQAIFFYFLKFSLKRYFIFILKFIILPFIISVVINLLM